MKKALIAIIFLISSIQAQDLLADRAGNGADGIMKDGIPYLLDLVESGLEKSPYFQNPSSFNPNLARFAVAHIGVSREVGELVGSKILEIQLLSPEFAFMILDRMRILAWKIIKRSLKDVPDDDSVFEFSNDELVQLAIRRGYSVTVDQTLFDQMTERNQCALIFHEIIFSLISYQEIKTQQGQAYDKQNAREARTITALIFSDRLPTLSKVKFTRRLKRFRIQGFESYTNKSVSYQPYVISSEERNQLIFNLNKSELVIDSIGYWSSLWESEDSLVKRKDGQAYAVPIFKLTNFARIPFYDRGVLMTKPAQTKIDTLIIIKLLNEKNSAIQIKNREIFTLSYERIAYLFTPFEHWVPSEGGQ